MSAVSAALRIHPALKVYNLPGITLDWHEWVRHSQGTLEATRAELIDGELERIWLYHEKGDLVSPAEVLEYLKKRDKR